MFENGGKDVEESVYISIDLKSFYASVECIERGLDPMRTNLVVADRSRTEKTICLAVSPALKRRGVAGRPRLFEVEQRVREINAERASEAPGRRLSGSSCDDVCLRENPGLAVAYLTAPPRMSLYIEWSAKIYQVYLKYIAPEDMHVYSIDEVFIDASDYLKTYGLSAEELARKMILDVQEETGITATAGIGTNLYLAKVAMDIVAKHMPPDENGVRTAVLDEMRYRRLLWTHRPLTDFWRVGRGYAAKLEEHGLFTMGDIARCSLGSSGEIHNEELLYRLFGVNAELLIESCVGMGILPDGRYTGVSPGVGKYLLRSGSAVSLYGGEGADGGKRDDGSSGSRFGGQEACDRSACSDDRIRQRESQGTDCGGRLQRRDGEGSLWAADT